MASTISVLDFPPEITSLIFLHCVLDEYNPEWHDQRLPTFAVDAAPLLLGRICSQWRNIAASTPELWQAIQVVCPYLLEDVVPHLDHWFRKAGSLPLTFDIRYKSHSDTSSDDLLKVLQRHAGQLQDLTLNITPADDLFRFVGPFPVLKTMFLTCVSLGSYRETIKGFKEAPELRNVRILANFSFRNIDLPWGQLTSIRIDSLTMPDCLLILSLASSLVTCRFEWQNANGPLAVVPPLLHLKSFILRSYGEPSTNVLRHLTTPALVHLEVEELDLDIWSAFLARSRCALDHLTVVGTGWTSAMYRQCLDDLPSLSELEVRQVGPSFFEVVRLLMAQPRFLPNLKSFTEDLSGMDSSWPRHKNGAELAQLVIEMLEARRGANEKTRLETFRLFTTKGFVGSSQLAERLKALVDGGMDARIAGSNSWARAVRT
ncbi:hypothetical protein DFH08DRAFT_879093 [Mycena albidolilacea]|uniref:F-box domain-containing protein n=1 Tax=Mycena albidolilacea TaxID=1033008 RepID=A0AAD6ZQY2_9AGAR|nr:hypothetical protein DFH08DRAFT_879093 [Mycena albidolilacea]